MTAQLAMQTSQDQGKALLRMLADYNGLAATVKALNAEAHHLSGQVGGLEEKAGLKGQIEADVAKLKVQRGSLEGLVSGLAAQKNVLDQIRQEASALAKEKTVLEEEVSNMEERKTHLVQDIHTKTQEVSDLADLESKHDKVSASLLELEEKEAQERSRWEIFQSFLGFVGSSSMEEVEKFAAVLPYTVEEAKNGACSPDVLRNFILASLMGEALHLRECASCGTRFGVDRKPTSQLGHHCPNCGLGTHVEVDSRGLSALKEVPAAEAPQLTITQVTEPKQVTGQGKKNA